MSKQCSTIFLLPKELHQLFQPKTADITTSYKYSRGLAGIQACKSSEVKLWRQQDSFPQTFLSITIMDLTAWWPRERSQDESLVLQLGCNRCSFHGRTGQHSRGWEAKSHGNPEGGRGDYFRRKGLHKQSFLETDYAASLLLLSGIALISVYFSDSLP